MRGAWRASSLPRRSRRTRSPSTRPSSSGRPPHGRCRPRCRRARRRPAGRRRRRGWSGGARSCAWRTPTAPTSLRPSASVWWQCRRKTPKARSGPTSTRSSRTAASPSRSPGRAAAGAGPAPVEAASPGPAARCPCRPAKARAGAGRSRRRPPRGPTSTRWARTPASPWTCRCRAAGAVAEAVSTILGPLTQRRTKPLWGDARMGSSIRTGSASWRGTLRS
mmetsp:Transcript_126780/g.370587  ORF Transcript_126780/g.370587 Transcript_126780/m.370587 type:complete len:221 (+) Transcript_126780:427-1089(+)